MATDMEEDRLEYEAEIAYITATSPVQIDHNQGAGTNSDFEFFIEPFVIEPPVTKAPVVTPSVDPVALMQVDLLSADKDSCGEKLVLVPDTPSKSIKEASHTSCIDNSLASPTVPNLKPSSFLPPTSLIPLTPIITPPHYQLDTNLPRTPTENLRRIQQAQNSSPLPRTTSPEMFTSQSSPQVKHKTLVIYGTTGCGKTGLVEKLVHTNPAVFAKVISSTTRQKRANEVNGVDFHFISEQDMSLGITQGDYLEYIQQKRQARKRTQTVFSRLGVNPNKRQPYERRQTASDISFPEAQHNPKAQRIGSEFDLMAMDSPNIGVKMFGTSKQALIDAGQLGKPCVILNVSFKGAQQLHKQGIDATFVLVHTGTTPPKDDQVKPDYVICSDNLKQAYSEFQQYAFQLIDDLNLTQITRFEITKHEWESIPTVEIKSSKEMVMDLPSHIRHVSFSEILAHFQSTDLSPENKLAKAELPKEGIKTRTKLKKKLHGERLLVFSMALCSLNNREKLHLRILQTIYSLLTGSNIYCRRFGMHWKDIGFNGVDPADDLQGVGMFGLAQLTYFLANPRTMSLAREIYYYSRQEPHVIPFCVLSFNMTQIALSALRGGYLTKLANKSDQVVILVNDFYTSLFYQYFKEWRVQNKSMLELGPLIQSVGEFAKKHVQDVFNDLESYLSMKEKLSQGPAVLQEADQKPFSQLDDYSDV